MSLRTRVSAAAVTAALCALLAPAAMASPGVSHAPAQVAGKKLSTGLLAPTGFLPGYKTLFASNSGGSLEHFTTFRIPSMKCSSFWLFNGNVQGFGENAFATETAASKSASAPVQEIFQQSVYQFASSHAASTDFSQVSAKYKSCKSTTFSDKSGKFTQTVHARAAERVGGHQALLLTIYVKTDVPGPTLVSKALWTLAGTDVYVVTSQLENVSAPKPTLTSLTLKLISRIRALK